MIIFVAISVVICCALVISTGIYLIHQLNNVVDDLTWTKNNVSEMYRELPYNSWFVNAYRTLDKKLDAVEDKLTTEIACLATKNNEDIKRMGGKFEEWDLIDLDGERWVIHRIDKNVNGDTFYRVHNAEGQITDVSGKAMQKATFVKHVSSPFEE